MNKFFFSTILFACCSTACHFIAPKKASTIGSLSFSDTVQVLEWQYILFDSLRDSLRLYSNLRRFSCEGCQIHQFPEEIFLLKKLEHLSLSDNLLDAIPPEIARLDRLQTLSLNQNQLVTLPGSLRRLKLRELDISNNPFQNWDLIGELLHLERLAASRTIFGILPIYVFKKNIRLSSVDFSLNALGRMPMALTEAQALTNLDLSFTMLDSLAPEVGRLKNLVELNLAGNNLEYLPAAIGQLSELQALVLDGNPVYGLPPEIRKLALNLEFLSLQECPNLTDAALKNLAQWLPKTEIAH
jgi:Leucine-rich repeat (LRR) protein